jgi:hypothetical protein
MEIRKAPSTTEDRVIAGALLAANVTVAIQLLQLNSLDASLTVTLWCVSLCAPILVWHILALELTDSTGYMAFPWYSYAVPCAWVGSIVAFGAAIHHLLPTAAYAYGGLCALSAVAYMHYRSQLRNGIRSESRGRLSP